MPSERAIVSGFTNSEPGHSEDLHLANTCNPPSVRLPIGEFHHDVYSDPALTTDAEIPFDYIEPEQLHQLDSAPSASPNHS